jgi:hypothetical protein
MRSVIGTAATMFDPSAIFDGEALCPAPDFGSSCMKPPFTSIAYSSDT